MGAAQTQGKGAYRIKMTEENRIGGGWVVDVYKIKRKDNNQVFAAKIFFSTRISMLTSPQE